MALRPTAPGRAETPLPRDQFRPAGGIYDSTVKTKRRAGDDRRAEATEAAPQSFLSRPKYTNRPWLL